MILQDARGLDVRSTIPSKVHVYEFKTRQERAEAVRNASNPSEAMRTMMILAYSVKVSWLFGSGSKEDGDKAKELKQHRRR